MRNAESREVKSLSLALKKLSLKSGDVLIVQSDNVDIQLIGKLNTLVVEKLGLQNIVVLGMSELDRVMVISEGEVTST